MCRASLYLVAVLLPACSCQISLMMSRVFLTSGQYSRKAVGTNCSPLCIAPCQLGRLRES
jgi:hypothetical protein